MAKPRELGAYKYPEGVHLPRVTWRRERPQAGVVNIQRPTLLDQKVSGTA